MSDYSLRKFTSFMREFDKVSILYLIPIIAVPFVLDYVFSLQPPWPDRSTYITAFLQLAFILTGFNLKIKKRRILVRWQIVLCFLMLGCFTAFFFIYSMFVTATPLDGTVVVSGFVCTADAVQLQRYYGPCPFLSPEALAAAEYETHRLWEIWTIRVVEFALFAMWSLFFIASAFFLAISLAFSQRQDTASTPQA